MSLLTLIREQIVQKGHLSFTDFMQQALYTPNLGYYTSGLQKFGVGGDFITAPELTPLFGFAVANQCEQILKTIERPVVFEFGAGSGRLCVDILKQLERLNCLPVEYQILELSAHLKQRQQALILHELPHLFHRVHWLSTWPTTAFEGVVIANEVLDAMPVMRFLQTSNGLLESVIVLNQQDELVEQFIPCLNTKLLTHVQTILPSDCYPYQSELNLFIDDWLKQCFGMLHKGALLLIDYGYPRHEFYHPDRCHGTLMCHYQHRSHTNPLIYIGKQDITTHVDFTHVAEAGFAAGFHVAGFTNQASFLLANGLLSCLTVIADEERIRAQQAIKMLTQPNEMGELFKVIALTKSLDVPLHGFLLQDKRSSL